MWTTHLWMLPNVAPGGGYQPRLTIVEPTLGAGWGGRGVVLVCDDTESIRRLLRINLELDGFEVLEACDGAAALGMLNALKDQDRLPNVVLLDAQMSPFDGWWALDQIRACPRLSKIPVLMATAENVCEDKQAMLARGLDACIQKPFDPDAVLDLVAGYVREGRAHVPQVM
jgi:CheY-like chemotaxis protein